LVSPKLLAFVPVTETPLMTSGVLPGFDRVMGRDVAEVLMVVLGKVSGFGLSTACGTSGGVPVPVTAADCGDPLALSATEMAAVRLAAVAGVNVTVIVQLAPAAREVPQLFVCPKLLALVPVTEMLVMVSAAVPGFESVIGNGVAAVPISVLGNASGFGLSSACGAVPVPVTVADCGEPVALSATEIDALRLPAAAGVKLTVMVQFAPAASEVPQLFVCPKLLAFVPATEMPVMVRAAVPGFESVIGSAVAAVPTSVLGKASGFGLSTACGAVPIPVRAAVCGDPVALSTTEIAALRLPLAAGVNVTVMVQLAPAAREAPQLFDWPKLVAFVPVTEMLVMVSAAVPPFDRVIGSDVADVPISVPGNASGFGLSAACGVGAAVPVPVKVMVCGEPLALSATESVAVKPVVEAGVKLT
jgi:hypothetical protein